MARQLKNTDNSTTPYPYKYGDGSAGAKTYSSNKQLDSSDGAYYGSFNGSGGATTGNTSLGNGTYNLPCKIVQSQGTGAGDNPNWELNFLISVSGGVATFKYPLTKNWNGGAQIITSNPWLTVTINNGVQIYAPAWNGSYGGELFLMALVSITGQSNNGILNLSGYGFRGGNGGGYNTGQQGEGINGLGSGVTNNNANGGGGGGYATDSGHVEGGNGGGGGNGASGVNGNGRNTGAGGQGGASVSNGVCSIMCLGAGGGAAGRGWNDSTAPDSGVSGSGNAHLLSKTITGIVAYLNGNSSANNSSRAAAGAAAGGCFLAQGQNISNLTIQCLGGTGGTCFGSFGGKGGDGGVGMSAIDYSGAVPTGISSNPSVTTTLTPALADTGGAFTFLIS